MTDDVPAVDRMQLYDLLRVQCFYIQFRYRRIADYRVVWRDYCT
jgi:hypothetical protein